MRGPPVYGLAVIEVISLSGHLSNIDEIENKFRIDKIMILWKITVDKNHFSIPVFNPNL